jgi:ABC-2 type transport system permease protein
MKWGILAMPSRTSLFNKEMILQIGRSIGWISVIYFLGLFFALPLSIMMDYSGDNYQYFTPVRSLFNFEFGIQMFLFLSIPVILAVFLYRFLHVKQAADLIHSLPIKRKKIYHFYTLTGMAFLILPVAAIATLTVIVHSLYDLNLYFQLSDIAVWTGTVILFNAVFYMAGVLVAMVTGISAVQGVLTYILLLFPAGFSLILIYNLGMMLYGFPSDYIQTKNIENWTPIAHLMRMETQNLSLRAILIYSIIVLLLYTLSLFIYKKRKIESASEAIAFQSLKVIFKYGVAFCTMLLGGMYFEAMQNQFGWLLFGYVLGGTIGYFTAEMVLQKSWRVFNNVRGLAIFAGTMVAFILVVQSLAPYEKRVPKLDEIKNVTISNAVYSFSNQENAPKPLKQKENIEAVRNFHSEIIKNEKTNELDMRSSEFTLLIYELENGEKVTRQYRIDPHDYEDRLKKIYESIEYKYATDPIFRINSNDVTFLRILEGSQNNVLNITDSSDVKEAITILKKEIENDPYDVDFYTRGNRSTIEIKIGYNEYIHTDLKQSYSEFIDWLREKDMLDQALVTPSDLDYIIVTNDVIRQEEFKEYPEKDILDKIISNKNSFKITNQDQLQAAIENAGYGWFNEEPYTAVFVYKNANYKEIRTFSEKYVPDFIKEHFQ